MSTSESENDSDFEFIDGIRAPKPRKFRKRTEYLECFDEAEFLQRFRMSKDSFRLLLDKIRHKISPSTAR